MTSFRDEIQQWPADHRDAFEERAAIMEFDAGMSRAKAEFQAYRDIKKSMEGRHADAA